MDRGRIRQGIGGLCLAIAALIASLLIGGMSEGLAVVLRWVAAICGIVGLLFIADELLRHDSD